ncbi:hypothetical protein EJ04DRAFT_270442 [Polyplosphaeria fusca]|uniref:Uncharacterized protein n=1 Tax=Polyplosphaeria fusca TaxID=682080 RepID=A0A9P4V1V9_9PLEO|nr:hypothetical protein EJ04DRAFT_270442 [Polyplosphaeria fusca]
MYVLLSLRTNEAQGRGVNIEKPTQTSMTTHAAILTFTAALVTLSSRVGRGPWRIEVQHDTAPLPHSANPCSHPRCDEISLVDRHIGRCYGAAICHAAGLSDRGASEDEHQAQAQVQAAITSQPALFPDMTLCQRRPPPMKWVRVHGGEVIGPKAKPKSDAVETFSV